MKQWIFRNFGWKKINRDKEPIPKWIWDRIHNEFNVRKNAYDRTYFYNGEHFSYKVKITSEKQGGCYDFYKKNRK